MAAHWAAVAAGCGAVALVLATPQEFQVWVVPLTAVLLTLLVMGKLRRVTSALTK